MTAASEGETVQRTVSVEKKIRPFPVVGARDGAGEDGGQLGEAFIGRERLGGRRRCHLAWGANLLRRFAPCAPLAAAEFKSKQGVVVSGRNCEFSSGSDAGREPR